MTPALVLELLAEAVRLGFADEGIVPWARQRHPELRTEPLPELDRTDAAREAAEKRVRELEEDDRKTKP